MSYLFLKKILETHTRFREGTISPKFFSWGLKEFYGKFLLKIDKCAISVRDHTPYIVNFGVFVNCLPFWDVFLTNGVAETIK